MPFKLNQKTSLVIIAISTLILIISLVSSTYSQSFFGDKVSVYNNSSNRSSAISSEFSANSSYSFSEEESRVNQTNNQNAAHTLEERGRLVTYEIALEGSYNLDQAWNQMSEIKKFIRDDSRPFANARARINQNLYILYPIFFNQEQGLQASFEQFQSYYKLAKDSTSQTKNSFDLVINQTLPNSGCLGITCRTVVTLEESARSTLEGVTVGIIAGQAQSDMAITPAKTEEVIIESINVAVREKLNDVDTYLNNQNLIFSQTLSENGEGGNYYKYLIVVDPDTKVARWNSRFYEYQSKLLANNNVVTDPPVIGTLIDFVPVDLNNLPEARSYKIITDQELNSNSQLPGKILNIKKVVQQQS